MNTLEILRDIFIFTLAGTQSLLSLASFRSLSSGLDCRGLLLLGCRWVGHLLVVVDDDLLLSKPHSLGELAGVGGHLLDDVATIDQFLLSHQGMGLH